MKSNILLLLASFLFIFIVTEVVLASFLRFEYQGEKTWIEEGNKWGNCYPTNSRDYFDIKRENPKTGRMEYCVLYDKTKRKLGPFPQNKEQIVLVGDSFTFGEGLKDEDTLGYVLTEKHAPINFGNYGQSAADIEYVYKVVNHLLVTQPQYKKIIYFYNINDVLMNEDVKRDQKMIVDFQNIRWEKHEKLRGPVARIFSKSAIYRLIEGVVVLRRESKLTVQNYLDMYSFDTNDEHLKKTLLLLRAMNHAARQKGVDFQVVMYPLLYKNVLGDYPFEVIHQLIKSFCKDQGITCIDLLPAFDEFRTLKQFTVHPLDYHPNEKANQLIVDYLKKDNRLQLSN